MNTTEVVMKKKIISLVALVTCVILFAVEVLAAYPISPKTQELQMDDGNLSNEDVIVYESDNPESLYAYSPAICKTSTERLIVSYDLGGDGATDYIPMGHETAPGWEYVGEVAYSDDGGENFTTTLVGNFMFARPFEVTNSSGETALYVIAHAGAKLSLELEETDTSCTVIYKSTDNGQSWSTPSKIHVNAFHSAPTEVMVVNDYVYMTMEYTDFAALNVLKEGGRGLYTPVLLRASIDSDLTNGENWEISDNSLCYLDALGWDGTAEDTTDGYSAIDYMGVPKLHENRRNLPGWLEGNLVQIFDQTNELYDENAFYVYLRSTAYSSGYANLMKIDVAENGKMTPSLVTTPSGKTSLFIQVPGGTGKYYITYDAVTECYWLVSNVNTDSMKNGAYISQFEEEETRLEGAQDERDKLGLYYSKNATNWNFAGYVSKGADETQARSYASMVVDGDDLVVVSRSGNEKAKSAHDTNQILLHRIENFRNLATDQEISDETTGLVYSTDLLTDSAVKDINTYITSEGKTLVTCSISGENGTRSKILLENAEGLYEEKLSTTCKLGEPVEVGTQLYVFAVADGKLLAFTSTNEGATWNDAVVVDETKDWYEAPTSAIVNDSQVMLALSVLDDTEYDASYGAIYGFDDETNTFNWDNTSRKATLVGKGAVGYSEGYKLADGESVSVTFKQEVTSSSASFFQVEFSDTPYSFYTGDNKDENGLLLEWQTYGDKSKAHFYWKTINDSVRGTQNIIKQHYAPMSGELASTCTYTVTLTRKGTGGVLSVEDGHGIIYHADIPAEAFSTNIYEKGVYLSAGSNDNNAAGCTYSLYEPERNREATWGIITGNTSNLVLDDEVSTSVTLKNHTSAYYNQLIEVKEGTKISFDVNYSQMSSGVNVLYAFALTDQPGGFDTVATANVLQVELNVVNNSSTVSGVVSKKIVGTDAARQWIYNLNSASLNKSVDEVYTVTYEKLNHATYSWKITVTTKLGQTTHECYVDKSKISDTQFQTGAYLAVGSRDSASTHVVNVSNVTVVQPEEANSNGWQMIGTTGSLSVDEINGTVATLNGNAKAYYNQKIDVEDGTKISFDVNYSTLSNSVNALYAFALTDKAGGFETDATANVLQVEINSLATNDYVQGVVSKKIVGVDTQRTFMYNFDPYKLCESKDTGEVYTVTYEKLNHNTYSWKITITTKKGQTVHTCYVEKTKISNDLFKDGVYIAAGSRDAGSTHVVNISNINVTVGDYTATVSNDNAYRVKPVVLVANASATLTDFSNWTCIEGKSFYVEIGNPYANNKFEYFGLPYDVVDARTIGWSDLKLFTVHDEFDMRGDGSVYGYMTLKNAGYNYAAMVKVDTTNNSFDYFVSTSGMTANEKEMITHLPGGNNGFDIQYDSKYGCYWLVTTENVDVVNNSDKSASKISLYHSTNAYDWVYAGKVAETNGDANVSAVLNGDSITITAVNNGVRTYTVSELYAKIGKKWSVIRGNADYLLTEDVNKIVLTNYGAARSNEKLEIVEGTEISFKLRASKMESGHVFAIGLLNANQGFVNETGDSGDGFVLRIAPWGQLNGASAYCLAVTDGKPASATNDNVTVSAACDMSPSDGTSDYITVKLLKDDSTGGSWVVRVQVGATWSAPYTIPSSQVANSLFDESGAYFVAGSLVDKNIEYEITELQINSPALGDINGDGKISILDVAAVDYNYRSKGAETKTPFDACERAVYDIDNDEKRAYGDTSALRTKMFENINYTGTNTSVDDSTYKVRLERQHFVNDEDKQMVSITLNTNFVCGGYEGVFTYDTDVLEYVSASYDITEGQAGFNGRNNVSNSIKEISEGIMTVAIGYASSGTKGNFVTLNFQVKDSASDIDWTKVAKFELKDAIFSNVQGNVAYDTTISETMLGDANEDYEIDVCDLVRMKKQQRDQDYSLNSDCDRSEGTAVDANDCNLLRKYLCSIISKF